MTFSVVVFSSVGGGPMERLAEALNSLGRSAIVDSAFSTIAWRKMMSKSKFSRVHARLSSFSLFPIKSLFKALVVEKSILVPTTNPFILPHVMLLSSVAKNICIVPLVYDLYPDAFETLGEKKSSSLLATLLCQCNRWMFKHADGLVFIGQRMAAHSMERYGEPKAWTVIETGADLQEFLRARRLLKTSGWHHEQWLKGRILVTYTGNLGQVHDWKTMSIGVKKLIFDKSLNGKFATMVVASGVGKAKMCSAFKGVDANSIKFLPSLDDEHWAQLMVKSDVSIVTLRADAAQTSIPSKTFSAMAAGNAILAVAPRNSDLADVVLDNNCGVVVEPGDVADFCTQLKKLILDADYREELSNNAVDAVAKNYDMPKLAEKWIAFFKTIQKNELY